MLAFLGNNVAHVKAVTKDHTRRHMPGEDDRIVLDGVTQMIRVYENGIVVKKGLFVNDHNPIIRELYLLLEAQIRG